VPKSKGRSKKAAKQRGDKSPEVEGKNPMASDKPVRGGYGGEFSAGVQQQARRRDTSAFKRNARGR
jgi:hypothetical protein